jgi:ABC-type uncharacterized transport system permease subunit
MESGKPPRDGADAPPPKPLRAALWAIGATGLLYVAAVAGFLAMVWTLFQLLMWVFTG